jgi:hypothetical protein
MRFWKRFIWSYTWSCLVWGYHYLSSLLMWIHKHLRRAIRVLCLQWGSSRIEIQGLYRSHLWLFLQWWMRRSILWKWPWLFDEVLLDILINRDFLRPVSLLKSNRLRYHRFDKLQLLWVHCTLFIRSYSLF